VVLIVGSGLELGAWGVVAGNLLVLASAVAWAAYTVQGDASAPPSRRSSRRQPASPPARRCSSRSPTSKRWRFTGWPAATWQVVLAVIYLGLFASGAAIVAWNIGVSRMEASAAGAFTNVVPLVGLLFAVLVGEPVTAMQLLGGVVAGAGIVLVQVSRLPGAALRLPGRGG
jgi:drug/metabolite transporter (DMT)-like permease